MYKAFSKENRNASAFIRYYIYANQWLPGKGLRIIGSTPISKSKIYPIRLHKASRSVSELVIVDDSIATRKYTGRIREAHDSLLIDVGGRSTELVNYRLSIFYRLFDVLPVIAKRSPIVYRWMLSLRSWYRKIFWTVFFIYFNKIETIYLTDSYIKIECIYIFRKLLNGTVLEFRHGLVSPGHVGYGAWIRGLSHKYRPDLMLHKGVKYDLVGISDIDLKKLNDLDENLIIEKRTYFRNLISVNDLPKKKKIIIVSQPTMRDYTQKIFDDLLNMGYYVKIRPHPSEHWVNHTNIDKSICHENLYIGWYSTYLLELYQLGIEVYAVNGFWNILTPLLPNANFIDYDSRNP